MDTYTTYTVEGSAALPVHESRKLEDALGYARAVGVPAFVLCPDEETAMVPLKDDAKGFVIVPAVLGRLTALDPPGPRGRSF